MISEGFRSYPLRKAAKLYSARVNHVSMRVQQFTMGEKKVLIAKDYTYIHNYLFRIIANYPIDDRESEKTALPNFLKKSFFARNSYELRVKKM